MRQFPQTVSRVALLASVLMLTLFCAPSGDAWAVGPAPSVAISHASDYVVRGRTLDVNAEVTLPAPAAVTTVRFRVLTAKDKVLYQHTESRFKLPAGTHLVRFERSTSSMGIKDGVYRLEVRVEASGLAPATVREALVVVPVKCATVPVAVVVRVRGVPLIGADGTPVSDPATSSAVISRDEAVAAVRLHEVRPDIPFTLAVPPVLLDDWRRVAQGYRVPGRDEAVSLEETVPSQFRDASHELAGGARAGLTFAGMPYAEPDIGGLASIGAVDDLASQMRLGSQVASSTLHTATPGAVLDGAPLTSDAVGRLTEQSVSWVLVSPSAVARSDGSTPTPGAYAVAGTGMTAVVVDERASALLSDPSSSRVDLLEHLYRRSSSEKGGVRSVVAVVEVGAEATATVADLQARLAALQRVEWIRLVTLPRAAAPRDTDTLQLAGVAPSPNADASGYWQRLAVARTRANALHASADPGDVEGEACVRGITLAEHRLWAGALRQAGEERIRAADELAMSYLSRLSMTAPDVTLSGTRGKVRVSITNASDKVLVLTVEAHPKDLRVLQDARIRVSTPPGETLIAIPVEVRSSLTGQLRLRLLADTVEVASASSSVGAGFLDRLVIVGGVAVILSGLLWYIRSKGRAAIEGIRKAAGNRNGEPASGRRDHHEEVGHPDPPDRPDVRADQ